MKSFIRNIYAASQLVLFLSQDVVAVPESATSTSTSHMITHEVPSFHFQDLITGAHDDDLATILTTTGILSIQMPLSQSHNDNHNTNEDESKTLLDGLCHCKDHINQLDEVQTTLLTDDQTTRSTIATATHGTDRPLPLFANDNQNHQLDKVCNQKGLSQNMDYVRDLVSRAVGVGFVPALDRLIRRSWRPSSYHTVLPVKYGEDYYTVASIIEDSQHLEHFHLYSKKEQQEQVDEENEPSHDEKEEQMIDEALGWHKDAGLFLAFLPASSCQQSSSKKVDDSLRIRLPSSSSQQEQLVEMIPTFPKQTDNEITVAIMLGNGAENWLRTPPSLSLKATSHTVKMQDGDARAWYGMMHLVPSHAIVHQDNHKALTLSDMKQFMVDSRFADSNDDNSNEQTHIAIGCGNSQPDIHPHTTSTTTQTSQEEYYPLLSENRRRLGSVQDGTSCNNSTNLFCWMNCLDIPNSNSIEHHFHKGESLYCLDHAVLHSTNNLQLAVEACTNPHNGIVGGIHRDSCSNSWQPTQDDVTSYLQEPTSHNDDDANSSLNVDDQYCWGATSMLMTGFEWESTTCIVYLFPSWVLTTRVKLAIASIGTIILGVFVELLIRQRSRTVKGLGRASSKLTASALFYGLQLTLAYFLMLVVMTYSGPLVLCVILGLVMGHVITNWNIFDNEKKKETGERHNCIDINAGGPGTPCCNFDENSFDNEKTTRTTDHESTTEEGCGRC